MPLDRLLARIIKDADVAGKALVEEAHREAERVRDESWELAEQAAEAVRREIMERAEKERVSIMGERLARSRATYLTRQEELYDEVFRDALREAASLPGETYGAWLKKTVMAGVSTGREELLAGAHDRRLLEEGLLEEINRDLEAEGLEGSLRLAPGEAPFDRGVILRGDRIEDNLSLETVLRRVLDGNEPELLNLMFGGARIKGLKPGVNGRRAR